MTLRSRVLLATATLVVVGALIAVLVGSLVVLGGFRDLEQHDAADDLERASAALAADVANLGSLALDWAAWDDTYAYVLDPSANEAYVQSNLVVDTLVGQALNLIAIVDQDQDLVHALAVDLVDEVEAPAAALASKLLVAGLLAPFDDSQGSREGLTLVDGRLLELAVRPVTTSDHSREPRGTLAMARWVSDDVVAELADRTRLDITLDPIQDAVPPGAIQVLTDDRISTATTLVGIGAEPVAELRVSQPRTFLSAGRSSVATMVAVIAGVLGVAGFLLLGLSDWLVLRPLQRLGREISYVGVAGNASGRVTVGRRRDEIGSLATHVNDMLGALEGAHQELELRNVELEEATRARQRFLSVVSHDLRSPLAAVRGFVSLLDSRWDELDEQQRRTFVRRIDKKTSSIEVKVGDLLTLSQLKEGQVVRAPSEVEVAHLLANVVHDLPMPHDDVVISDTDGLVYADPDHVRRIVGNLVDNARKYGAPPVELSSSVADDATAVEIRVTDHGDGIAADFAPTLFDAFTQSEPKVGVSGGIGLGLSIVAELAAANDGSVRCELTTDGGACFVVTLPTPAAASAASAASAPNVA